MTHPNRKPLRFAHVGSLGTHAYVSTLGQLSLFLAPLMYDSENYAQTCIAQSSYRHTILDSGALELTEGTEKVEVPGEEYIDMALTCRVSEVVCPDTPWDPRGSLLRTCEFIEKWYKLPSYDLPRLMVVPHGRSVDEWLSHACILVKRTHSCTVGIPRILSRKCGKGSPSFRVSLAIHLRTLFPNLQLHLLGAGEDFLEELLFIYKTNVIRSIDSTFLHRYAVTNSNPFANYIKPQNLHSTYIPNTFKNKVRILISTINKLRKSPDENSD